MSDTTTNTTATSVPEIANTETTSEAQVPEGEAPPEAPSQSSRDSRRDARTREKLRAVEAERDTLLAALVPHVRAEAERIAAERLASGASLWLLPELDPMSLVDDDFMVDSESVAKAVERLLAAAPQIGKGAPPSFDSGARTESRARSSWSLLLDTP